MDKNTLNKKSGGPVIGLFGHTGNQNLGDEAITQSVVQNLQARIPGVQFRLFSIHPTDSEQRYGFPAFAIRPSGNATVSSQLYRNWQAVDAASKKDKARAPLHERDGWAYTEVSWRPSVKERIKSLIKLILKLPAIMRNEYRFSQTARKQLADVDLLIVTGSNQFLDNFGGPWAFPFTLYRWSRLAAKTNTKLAYASVGAGPIYSTLSMKIIRRALGFADYVSVRDVPSKSLLTAGGCDDSMKVCPDLAFGLHNLPSDPQRVADWQRPVVGINPMPVYASNYWYVSDTALYKNYTESLAEFALSLQDKGYPFFFFATQSKDENVMVDVFSYMEQKSSIPIDIDALVKHSDQVDELTQIVHSADVVVATRFHGTVLGLFAKKPVIGTCYYRKSGDVLDDFGLHDYVLPLEKLKAEQLVQGLDSIQKNQPSLQKSIDSTQQQYRQQLDQQFDDLVTLLAS